MKNLSNDTKGSKFNPNIPLPEWCYRLVSILSITVGIIGCLYYHEWIIFICGIAVGLLLATCQKTILERWHRAFIRGLNAWSFMKVNMLVGVIHIVVLISTSIMVYLWNYSLFCYVGSVQVNFLLMCSTYRMIADNIQAKPTA